MPLDPEDMMADAILKGAQAANVAGIRGWNVGTFTRQRMTEGNPTAGDVFLQEIAPTFTVGWDGIGTTHMPFTPNVSVLNGSFQSTDIVTGS